jgi:perosamine synthetase
MMGEIRIVPSSKIPLSMPTFDEEMREAAVSALQNERFVGGESVHKFEEEFARYCGTRFAVSTASGTAALVLSLIAEGVRGGEVVTAPASFVASANSIIHAGATPKFADIDLRTYTIDPEKVRASLGKNVKALIPVHLYGFPAPMKELCELASERGIAVIEDACQAHGASYDGKKAGSIGDAGCFSFFPSKNMTVGGDGGMMVTNDESIAERVRSLRDCGRAKGSKYTHDILGFTERLNTVQAAIGRIQLKRLDDWNGRRRKIASEYNNFLSALRDLVTPPSDGSVVSQVYHMYAIRCNRRDELREWLGSNGVETGVHYTAPIHLQPIYRQMFGYKGGEFPNSEALCNSEVSIPMYPSLKSEDVEFISGAIHDFYQERTRKEAPA